MKKFEFRLENVLRLRSHKAKAAKEEFALAVGRRAAKDEEIRLEIEYFDSVRNRTDGRTDAAELKALYHHKKAVENKIYRMKEERVSLLEIENAKRIEMNEALKEEKILLRLKEKRLEEYKIESSREETMVLDEIAGQRHTKIERTAY